ncbi:MAG: nucleoside hydrolase [Burkholderiaceae bacterium]
MNPLAKHGHAWYRSRLALPGAAPRIVIDSDAANEIDDQFALAWALLSPQQLRLEAVYAAPFSFDHWRLEMIRARNARDDPASATPADLELLHQHAGRLAHAQRQGWVLERLALPPFNPPDVGMERSYQEILTVFDKCGINPGSRVHRGAPAYLQTLGTPVRSAAAEHLVHTALAEPGDDPLYVVAIGCLTNIASALLMAPEIAQRIVVVWTAGYPSHAPQPNFAFNLEQDMRATNVVLDSGVPHVYLPGYHVGAQLRLSYPEVQRYVAGRGAIGDYLHHLFTHNPLWELHGIDSLYAHSWVIWDLIAIAWLMNPAWVASDLTPTPVLGADRRWRIDAARHPQREAYAVHRDPIFADLFRKLEAATSAPATLDI